MSNNSTKMSHEEREKLYGVTIASAYPTKNGFWTLKLRAQEFDAIQKIQIGGKLTLNLIPEETRAKSGKLPPAFIKYLSPELVAQQDADFEKRKGGRAVEASDDI
jgi:hypothetical protein